jgi:hypothetical protein
MTHSRSHRACIVFPSQSNNTTTHNVTINVFDILVRLSDDGHDFVGELAQSWKVVDPTT